MAWGCGGGMNSVREQNKRGRPTLLFQCWAVLTGGRVLLSPFYRKVN